MEQVGPFRRRRAHPGSRGPWVARVLAWTDDADGTDAGGMLGLACFSMALPALAGGAALIAWAIWRRRHAPRHDHTPTWRPDPWKQAEWRLWDGTTWTDFTP